MTQQPDSISSSFDAALSEFDFAMLSPKARAAIGRLVALELSSYLGLPPARRVLAAERHALSAPKN